MKKNTIRLNESQLRQIVKESVKKVLNEKITAKPGHIFYGEGSYHRSLTDHTNQVIPNEVEAMAQRVENLAKRLGLDEPQIQISSDYEGESHNSYMREWFTGKMSITFHREQNRIGSPITKKFCELVYKMFNYYSDNVDIKFSNSKNAIAQYILVSFDMPIKESAFGDSGRNDKTHITNYHGMNKHGLADGYDWAEDDYKSEFDL